jgi:hypothetical protein
MVYTQLASFAAQTGLERHEIMATAQDANGTTETRSEAESFSRSHSVKEETLATSFRTLGS